MPPVSHRGREESVMEPESGGHGAPREELSSWLRAAVSRDRASKQRRGRERPNHSLLPPDFLPEHPMAGP